MKTFYLIDGHAQIFRAYYAPFQALTASGGEPVKATHTFTQMLLGIIRDKKPDYLAIALDTSDATTFRAKSYPEYKANRDATPEDLGPQIERIEEIIETFGIPVFRREGFEADDIIATIVGQLSAEGAEHEDVCTYIVSRDKDLFQLLSDRVIIWDPGKDEIIGPTEVEAKYGFTPEQSVEVQVLTGDTVDNIPGVKGVGTKTAVKLLKKYNSVEGVFQHADELTPKQRENVLAYRDKEALTRELVTLRADVELDFDFAACRTRGVPTAALRPIFEKLGFRRLLTQLDTLEGASQQPPAGSIDPDTLQVVTDETPAERKPAGEYVQVADAESFASFMKSLSQQGVFAVDTETTSLNVIDCELVGIAFSWEASKGYYLPLRSQVGPTLEPTSTLAALKPILEDPNIEKYGQNLKYDLQVFRTVGIALDGVKFDSMVASYLLYPERRTHGMDVLSHELLGHTPIPITDLIGKGKKQRSMTEVDLGQLTEYAGEDADITWRLCQRLRGDIETSPMKSLYYDVELPLVGVLADMEYEGVALDSVLLKELSADLESRLADLRDQIYRAAGREFTVDSPKQLAEVLFDEQGLRVVRKTKTSRSTDAEVLTTLALETAHPLPGLVLEYRELTKLRGTYVDPLPQMVSKRSGRLHPSYHQTVTATGRLSSSDPNIQNIPIRTEQGREIRKAFVARDANHVLIAADYSQIELRVLAHLSKDPALIAAFENDQDIHRVVASQVNGVPLDEVTSEQRGQAKAINFGIIYGQGAYGLGRTLGIPNREAAAFIAAYKERYLGIVRFMEECIAEAEETGRVSTLLGRQRTIPEIHSRNKMQRALGERLAINTVVQGTAADMIKVAMVRTHRRLAAEAPETKLLIQVHDELVLEAPVSATESSANLVEEEMARAMPLDVPVRVDCAWGSNWLEAKG